MVQQGLVMLMALDLGVCEAHYVPIPRILRGGRWRLILSAVQALNEGFLSEAPSNPINAIR